VDAEGHSRTIFKDIIDHGCNDKVGNRDPFIDKNGRTHPHLTATGWELELQWADGATDGLPLKDVNDPNPIQATEYAVSNNIASEPTFVWRARDAL
jgi:hypothetical protein